MFGNKSNFSFINTYMKTKKSSNKYRSESYFICPNHSAWSSCDSVCWEAKNLRNYANYIIRQEYIKNKKYLNYFDIEKKLKELKPDCFKNFPAKLAQHVLIELDQNWKSYFAAIKEYRKSPHKFLGPPKIPGYKDTKRGRSGITFDIQRISIKSLKKNLLKLSSLDFLIKLRLFENVDIDGVVSYTYDKNLKVVSIVPKNDGYLILVNYLDLEKIENVKEGFSAGIDLGVNNLASVSTNNKENSQFLVNGRPLKAMNAFFNKRLAKLQSNLHANKTKRGKKKLEKEMQKLCRKRNFRVKNFLHNTTKMLVNQLVSANVTRLVIGKNVGWKQEVNIGKKSNQNFVYIPHAKFIDMLKDKWIKLGRRIEVIEESYTSKCSFLDQEEICKHEEYLGKRKCRGLFVSKEGYKINADINGASNILRKGISNAFDLWSNEDLIKGFVVSPRRITVSKSGNTLQLKK